jgi:uncharacterized SAM-binding protein YcdF (DUF218 family)
MLFWLKKAATLPFLPLHFCLLAGLAGIALAAAGRTKAGKWLLMAAVGAVAFFSNGGVARLLLRPLEYRYAPWPEYSQAASLPSELQACRAVVVLGGGHADSDALSRVNQLSSSALSRLTEGIRLARRLPAAVLVVSGNNGSDRPSHAQILAEAAISLGFPAERIVRMDEPRDTEEEAAGLAHRFPGAPVAVVTSAWHLPRAMALCARAGLQPVACPADFGFKETTRGSSVWLTWDLEALERSTRAIHERLGRGWATIRGKS